MALNTRAAPRKKALWVQIRDARSAESSEGKERTLSPASGRGASNGSAKPFRSRVRPISRTLAKLRSQYRRDLGPWLTSPENRWCLVSLALGWKKRRATQCHHFRGRVNALLLDKRFWLPVSMAGHQWIQDHPKAAQACGLVSGPREWNLQAPPQIPMLDRSSILKRSALLLKNSRNYLSGGREFRERKFPSRVFAEPRL